VKISLDWLAEYVSWDDEPTALADKLTAAGLNVESIEEFAVTFPGVVVARVTHREQHPDADRLSLCRVDDGSGEEVQVVCGAPNVREGITVLFARVGALLPGDFKIKKTKIRGVVSMGMICSATELELGSDGSGIMELETDLAPGTSADELYGFRDTVLDIEVTPNRPDWLSHIGVAREVAAIYGTKVSMPPCWSFQQGGEGLDMKVSIKDYEDCPRYAAFGVIGVTTGPSPDWMQHRLRAIGSRPISNLVDITNYVLFEMGQPLHAFDRAKLTGDVITIKRAGSKIKVTTLDDIERELDPDTLMIMDEAGPVALAGVMGLANTEVGEDTSDILLESAFFHPGLVRTASRGLGLISEASYRFERGADWDMVERAGLRALQLFNELAGGHVIPDWFNRQNPDHKAQAAIPLRVWQVNRVLGTDISPDQAAQHLQSLGLKVQPMGSSGQMGPNAVNMMVEIPSFRRDLLQEIDLIEEIARSYGLDHLSGGGTFRGTGGTTRRDGDRARGTLRRWFAASGYHEMVTSSFLAAGDNDKLGLAEDDVRRCTLAVINPHHGGDTQLRTSLLPELLHVARRNLNAGAETPVRLFQIDRTYWPAGEKRTGGLQADDVLLPQEPAFLQFAVAGSREAGLDGVPADLLEIKGTLEALSATLRIPLEVEPETCENHLQEGTQWRILDGEGRPVGSAGRVATGVLEAFDLDLPVAVAEISFDALDKEPAAVVYRPFARYPAVKRDLSLLVPVGVAWEAIRTVVADSAGPHLADLELFDIYRGKGVPEGSGAFGIRLKFRSEKGNLKGKTVDRAISGILEGLEHRLGIKTRGQDGA
jgi:phenylalanyl-tRNA synthetase beta chain